jgi:hypothetical protein
MTQLFDTLDPFPFREPDLDQHAEEYIVGWAREFPRNKPFKIIIHAPKSELEGEHADEVREVLGRYFSYRSEVTGRELNELFRVERQSLLIGILWFAAALSLLAFAARLSLSSVLKSSSDLGGLTELLEVGTTAFLRLSFLIALNALTIGLM